MAAIGLRARVIVRFEAVAAGAGPAGLGGINADDPSYGQSLSPGATSFAQTEYFQDAEQVPGTPGSWTLANLNTALTSAVTTLAGATGTPVIDATTLANINAWATGGP